MGEQPLGAEPPSQRPPQPPGPGRRAAPGRAVTRRRWSPPPRRSRRAGGHRPGRAAARPMAATRTTAGAASVRAPRRTRDSSRSLPRIAAVGGTRDASIAGRAAASSDSGTPTATASARCAPVSAGGAAAVAMYSVLTVAPVNPTAQSASRRPRPMPATVPASPSSSDSPRNSAEHLAPRDAERAQHPDLFAARQDVDRRGVVDQKQPDDERHPRQRRQVQVERRQHLLDLLAAAGRPAGGEPRRQPRLDGRDGGVDVGAGRCPRPVESAAGPRNPHVEAIEAAEPGEGELGRGDVHQHEAAVHHPRRASVLEQRAHDVGADAIAGDQADLVAEPVAAAPGQLLGDDHALRAGQDGQELLRRERRAAGRHGHPAVGAGGGGSRGGGDRVVADRAIAQDVDAQHLDGFGAARPRHPRHRVGHQGHLAFDHRRDLAELAQPAQRGQQRLVHPGRGGDLDRGMTGDGVERGLEAADRAGVGELDGDHHRDAGGDAGHRRQRARPVAEQPANDELDEEAAHPMTSTPIGSLAAE